MLKKLKYLLFLFIAILITGSFNEALANAFESYTKANFDDCMLNTAGNNETTVKTVTYEAETGSFSMTYLKGREISAVTAPPGKTDGTSFTTNGIDNALQMNFVSGNTTNNSFWFAFDSTKNLYEKDKIILSMNVLMDNFAGAGYLQAVVRYNSQVNNPIFRLTTTTIDTYPEGINTTVIDKYTKNKWYNIKFEFNPKARTYDFFIDNEKMVTESLHNENVLFPGDPLLSETGTSKQPIKEVRFTMGKTSATTNGAIYFDDIYFGEPIQELTNKIDVTKTYFTNGITNLKYIPFDKDTIYGKADVIYSKNTIDKSFTLAAALYNGDDKLKKVWYNNITLPATELSTNANYTANLNMPLDGVILEQDDRFKIFAVKSFGNITPLCNVEPVKMIETVENAGENPTIHLVGDSICMTYNDTYFPKQGFGYYVGDYFKSNVKVVNWALGGKSTRSFIDEGRWNGQPLEGYKSDKTVTTGILNVIKPGDYVFVCMGHNDSNPKIDSYGYSKATTIEEYKNYLRRYASEARSAGANIIFITSIPKGDYETNALLQRAVAMREVGIEQKVAVLDVNDAVWNHFKEIGVQAATDKYFMSNNAVRRLLREALSEEEISGRTEEEIEDLIDIKVMKLLNNPDESEEVLFNDFIHVNFEGADYIAQTIANLLRASESPLKNLLLE